MQPISSPVVIYRYQPVRPDAIDSIQNARLWFSNPSRFNDPFDFLPSFKEGEGEIRRALEQSREAVRWTDFGNHRRNEFLKATELELIRRLREWSYFEQTKFRNDFAEMFRVACFSEANNNLLMWSHYADSHRGICIGLRPPLMRLDPKHALSWKVDYDDERLPYESGFANQIALRKAKVWKHEQEWRIVMAKNDLALGNRPLPRTRTTPRFEPSYFLKLQWDAIESVRFGALVDRKKRSIILKTLRAEERRHIQAIQMHLSVDRFALEEEILRL